MCIHLVNSYNMVMMLTSALLYWSPRVELKGQVEWIWLTQMACGSKLPGRVGVLEVAFTMLVVKFLITVESLPLTTHLTALKLLHCGRAKAILVKLWIHIIPTHITMLVVGIRKDGFVFICWKWKYCQLISKSSTLGSDENNCWDTLVYSSCEGRRYHNL